MAAWFSFLTYYLKTRQIYMVAKTHVCFLKGSNILQVFQCLMCEIILQYMISQAWISIWCGHKLGASPKCQCGNMVYTVTHRETDTRPFRCSISYSVLRGSTLLNWIPHSIDYYSSVPCFTVGFCMPTPHQDHTQSLGRKMEAIQSPSSCPEPCLLAIHDQKKTLPLPVYIRHRWIKIQLS